MRGGNGRMQVESAPEFGSRGFEIVLLLQGEAEIVVRNCKSGTLDEDGAKLRHGFVELGSEEIGEADIHLSGFVGWIDLENLVELDEGQFRLPRIRQRQSEIIADV